MNDTYSLLINALSLTGVIISVDDFLISDFILDSDNPDSELQFSYTDEIGQIFEYSFSHECMLNAVVEKNKVTVIDNDGYEVTLFLLKLTAFNIIP